MITLLQLNAFEFSDQHSKYTSECVNRDTTRISTSNQHMCTKVVLTIISLHVIYVISYYEKIVVYKQIVIVF